MGQSNSSPNGQISPGVGENVASAAAAEVNAAGSALHDHGHAHSDGIPHHTGKSGSGRFRNPWKSFRDHGFLDAITCFVKDFKKVEPVPEGSLPIVESDWKSIEAPPGDAVQVTWVGHASFLVQFDGINVLTDPIFSERCAPVQFAGPKRHVPPAFPTTRLPRIDAVIISHNHYDHLDSGTVGEIKDKVRMWFVPLGIKEFLVGQGINPSQVSELDWWQEQELAPVKNPESKEDNNVRFVCTPCQHFSGRSLTDRNATLWASWSLIGPTKRFYFGGDTGYRSVPKEYTEEMVLNGDLPVCPAFKEIGEKFGPFNLAALPIGAYSPRWFMSPIHCSPEDSVAVHIDIKAKQSVGMHWGTFILTDEPILEPPVRLAAELKRKGISSEAFVALAHGETRAYRD